MKLRICSTICALGILTLVCALTVGAQAGEDSLKSGQSIQIRWFGQAAYEVTTSKGTTIIIDPIQYKGYSMPEGITADIVTISHEHIDHNCIDAVSNPSVVFHGTDEECQISAKVDTTVEGVRLYSVASFHDSGRSRANTIFVFEFDGVRMAHLGDIGTTLTGDQIKAIGEVDILMIPVGGQFTVGAAGADSIVNQLEVKRFVFPMHYRTEAFGSMPYTAEPFLEGKENVRRVEDNNITFDLSDLKGEREYLVLQY